MTSSMSVVGLSLLLFVSTPGMAQESNASVNNTSSPATQSQTQDLSPNASKEDQLKTDCNAAQEFIDAMKFLRTHEVFRLDEPMNQKVAFRVSLGCTGAAKRFQESIEFLEEYEIYGAPALQISQALALETDMNFETFKAVFSRAHEKKHLDMTLQHAYEIAQEMSLNYKGDLKKGLDDFEAITNFCTQEEIHPSKPRCAFLGTAVAKLGEEFEDPMAPVFKDTYKYLHETHGVHMAESLVIAHEVASISPHAFKNFKLAYEYGLKKEGLDLQARQSLQFAMEMSTRTVEGKGERKFERLPANISKTPLPPLHDVKVKGEPRGPKTTAPNAESPTGESPQPVLLRSPSKSTDETESSP